ncbi:unnamed protein product, partial [Cladocopium goreaui]
VHVERAIRWIGYRMQWQRIIDAKAVMGITRSRWLAVAVRAHSHVNTAPFPPWVFPQDHKIDHAQFLLPWNQKTLDALAITDEICRVASDPRKAGRTILAKSPEQVMQQRLYDTNMILPPFMARYGSQHELSDTHLNDHSYYGFFLAQPQLKHGGRLFHPAEIGLLHGAFDWMFVDDDLHHSWLVMGNSILPFHALIPLMHVINAFLPTKILPNQVLDQFIKYRLSTSTIQVTSMNGGALYTNEDHMPDGPFLESAQSLAGFVHAMDPLAVWLPRVGVASLKQCTGMSKQPQPEVSQPASVISVPSSIEPTVPFAVVLQAVITADAFEQSIMLQFLPQRTHGVIPPKAFDIAMSVLAFRSLLSAVLKAYEGGGGNTGAKHQNRMMQQSALASYLLEQGYELSWVTSTVDTLCNRFGLAKLQHVTAMPVGSQKMTALLALLKEASIAVPALPTPQTRKQAQGMPWQKPKKHKGDSMIDPSEYSFIPGFFQNQDTSPCAQLDTIRPQATGVAIASPAQSATWLTAQEKISSDELALLIVGKPPATTMQGVEITVPCHNRDGQMVLLHCHLFQLGTKDVTFQQGDPHMVMADKCALVALTLYKTDFTGEHWTDALQRTVPFIRQILDKEGLGEHVLSIWGRSFRNERAACSPLQALTLQVHCSVLEDKLPKLLAKSGFNKLYCTPKTADGRLDTTYRVLWLADSGQAAVYSAKVANSLGLVKGKKTLGLRFRASDFDSAWAVLCPGQPMPGQKAGELVFRVDGLPFGVTTTMIDTWAQKIKWNCQAVRALGPQAMLVRSDEQPPPGVVMFNTQAVLIRHLPPRTRQNAPLMVGPRSAKPKDATKDHNPDPWAAWQGPRLQAPPGPAAGNRSIDGPTETRLAAQDQKLQHIEKQLQTLAASSEQFAKQTEERFAAAEEREQRQSKQVAASMEAIRQDLDRSLHAAFHKSTQAMDERMAELKHLLISTKCPPPDNMEPCAAVDKLLAILTSFGNLGPEDMILTWGITNPTTIVSKSQRYEALIQEHNLDLFSASETVVECAVDIAYRRTQVQNGTPWTATQAKIKQVRRVKALYHRLCAAQNTNHYSKWNELHQEWQAILRSKAFGKSFVQWCQNMPELGPAPLAVPSAEYLHVMLQLLQHLTDIEIAFDAKLQKDRQAHARHLDRTYRGHATAYARIKEQTMPPVSQMKSQITEEAVVVPQPDGQLLAFCDNPKQFDMAATGEQLQLAQELSLGFQTAELWRRTGTFPVSLGRLAMARLQGPQTIHRAELMAVVKAHQEPTLAHTALEVYDILGNRQADEMAVATCKSFQPEVAQLCQDMYMDVQCDKLYLRSFLAYLLDLRRHFALLQADKTELTVHADLRANTAPEPRDILANWQVPYPRAAYDVGVTFLQYSAWGRPFADMVLQWMRQVEWPDTEEVDEKDPGISWIELVTSFVLWSKIMPPLKRKDLAGTDFLQCIDSLEQDCQLITLDRAHLGGSWTQALKQVAKGYAM